MADCQGTETAAAGLMIAFSGQMSYNVGETNGGQDEELGKFESIVCSFK